ncbi:MAG: GTP-binding protein [Promethearchaeota archaeon]|nr:MAG: GTP-binding protein [Candidatus Lokiarchaeota archaeon]
MSDYKFKLPIIGDGGVGKTTLTHRYLHGIFEEKYALTIGMEFYIKKLEVDGKLTSLHIWDFAGEDKFRFLLPGVINGANGTLFMFDITRYKTFNNLKNWLAVFNETNRNYGQEVETLLIGSKLDLEQARTVSIDEAREFAKAHNFFEYIECSSKTGENVELIFEKIAQLMLKKESSLLKKK